MATQKASTKRFVALLASAALVLSGARAVAQVGGDDGESDRTLAPYFFVPGEEGGADLLPLRSTDADVRIAGVVAEVTVTQVYGNRGPRAIEAVYVFPASTRAAVHGLRMKIGRRTVEATIARRDEARAAYEQARGEGRTASLLEQQRPNVFTMNVANILPGDEIRVELRYSELLVPEDGVYEFVVPTVVGPRHSNVPAAGAPDTERWVADPYLREGAPPSYAWGITVALSAGLPIAQLGCPTHLADIRYEGPSRATVTVDPKREPTGGNRDFVLRYSLRGARLDSGLLLYRDGDDGYFLLVVEPPQRVATPMIVPREFVFVVDVSGSMNGFPLDVAKKLLRDLIGGLRPVDRFNVVLFAGGSSLLAEASLPASEANLRRAVDLIERERGGGGTELVPALRRALALPREEGVSRTVVVVTDGYVSAERETFELIRASLGDANLFAFGIGSSVNRFLIEGMARAGRAEPFVVLGAGEAAARAARFRRCVEAPVLTAVRLEAQGFEAFDLEPPALPDVLAERPVVVVGRWRGAPRGRLVVTGTAASGRFERAFEVARVEPRDAHAALRPLWARQRVEALADAERLGGDEERRAEITRLGLAYSLLTAHTSFVAVDTVVRGDGLPERVVQPLPLPQGVSDLAVGDGMAKLAMPAAALGGFVAQESAVSGAKRPASDEAACADGCLEQAALGWRLPAAAGESTVTLTLTVAAGAARVERVDSRGALPLAQAERVVREGVRLASACLSGLSPGRWVVVLTVAADGRVVRVRVI
jgi:Ca-activated chloride channel family protein